MTDEGTTVLGGGSYPPDVIAALVRATEAAAEACRDWFGRHDKNAADAAAVAAMRAILADAPFEGTVVIGEGEKDAAPMLANGERLGRGGPECDIAVDPLDGTRLVAEGLPGSIAVIALAPRGTMFDPRGVFYLDKLVCGSEGAGRLDIRRSATENLAALSAARAVPIRELTVALLDKPRHVDLVAEIRNAGARVHLVGEGDVATAIAAATPRSGIDLALGVGGTPEGVISACAIRALGGFIQGRLAPRDERERESARAAGYDLARVLEGDDLVGTDRVLFVSTPVSVTLT